MNNRVNNQVSKLENKQLNKQLSYQRNFTVGRVGRDLPDAINIKIDRTTVLGNPYFMKSEKCRDRVCEQYKNYFNIRVRENTELRKEVIRIFRLVRDGNKVNLQCWCAPKRCHGHYIRKFILDNLEKV